MIFIGDDPGCSGAIVAIDDDANVIDVCRKNKSTDKDRCEFIQNLDSDQCNGHYAVVEKVNATPQMGVVSAFKFGQEFRSSLMMYTALSVRYELFTPQAWQKSLGLTAVKKSDGDTAKKRYLRGEAERLFPDEKIVNDTADAYLIAWFARNIWKLNEGESQ